jgi:hypothetical protein
MTLPESPLPNASVPSNPSRRRALPGALAVTLALAGLGCVDHNQTSPIYIFDGANSTGGTVLEWDDVAKVNTSGGTSAAADRTITGSFSGASTPLGWGGMVLDESADQIYLVFQDGTGYVIKKASGQNGSISGTDNIISFTLDNSGSTFSTGSFFGQAALDSSNHVLYVMETAQDGSNSRVWFVPGINTLLNGASFTTSNTFNVSGDKWGAGLAAAPGGRFWALFGYGSTVYDSLGASYSGERLRMGSGSSFGGGANSQVLVGDATQMNTSSTNYGTLAYDSQNALVYAFVKPASGATTYSVLVFGAGQFNLAAPNQAPKTTIADTALQNLRILAHPPYNDWMAGADFTAGSTSSSSGTGGSTLHLWDQPSNGAASTTVTMSGATEIRGIAFGPNSN